MKLVFILLLFVTILYSSNAGPDEIKVMMKNAQKECMREVVVSQAIVDKITNNVLVDDEGLKEYIFCMHVRAGHQNADGSFNLAVMKQLTMEVVGTDQYNSILDECTKNPTNDGVANAWQFIICFTQYTNTEELFYFASYFWPLSR